MVISLHTHTHTHKGAVPLDFDILLVLRLNNTLTKWSCCRWFETPWRSWHVTVMVSLTQCIIDPRFAPSQWETVLLSNDVSHWLIASLEPALQWIENLSDWNDLPITCEENKYAHWKQGNQFTSVDLPQQETGIYHFIIKIRSILGNGRRFMCNVYRYRLCCFVSI